MTNDLSQCGNCIYHYTYNGQDMCKQVGDDFYLQWKVENCPYHTTITRATAISDEIYRLRAENADLRERLEKAVELQFEVGSTVYTIYEMDEEDNFNPSIDAGKVISFSFDGILWIFVRYNSGLTMWYTKDTFDKEVCLTLETAEARLAEMKGEKK